MNDERTIELSEWGGCDPTTHPALRGLFLDDQTIRRQAEALTQTGILLVTEGRHGLTLQSTSYVGRLQLGPLTVVIRPKISGIPLMQLLRYALGLRNLRLFDRLAPGAQENSLQELLVLQLYREVEELMARGLHRPYVRTAEALASLRGRINIEALATGRFAVSATLPCIHHPRREEAPLNQALLGGLHLGARISADVGLRTGLLRQAAILRETVTEVELTGSFLRRAQGELNRLTEAYRPALSIIEVLLGSTGMGLDGSDRRVDLPGFAFDMNRLFQALVGRFLKENLPDHEVAEEYRMGQVLAYDPQHNPRRKQAPELRPDFALSRGGKLVAILDAKYRDLWELDLPREMLYQLAVYALTQGQGGVATIIYPTVRAEARESRVNIGALYGGPQMGQVVLRPVNLTRLAALVEEEGGAAGAVGLASELCFGRTSGPQRPD